MHPVYILLTMVALTVKANSTLRCGAGLHLHHDSNQGTTCRLCPEQTFMSDTNHTNTRCLRCLVADKYVFEYEAEKCTPTTNTKILCINGYYRSDHPPLPECRRCHVCGVGKASNLNYTIRQCADYTNTLCCEKPDMVAVEVHGKSGRSSLECRPRLRLELYTLVGIKTEYKTSETGETTPPNEANNVRKINLFLLVTAVLMLFYIQGYT